MCYKERNMSYFNLGLNLLASSEHLVEEANAFEIWNF